MTENKKVTVKLELSEAQAAVFLDVVANRAAVLEKAIGYCKRHDLDVTSFEADYAVQLELGKVLSEQLEIE